MRRNRKQRRIMFLLILILGLTIGFALLSTNLYINGTANIKGNTWSIHWNSNSINVTTGSVTATDPVVSTTTSANDTVTFSANLGLPGEFYEFTIDAINDGSIDGELNTLVTKVYDSNDQELTGNNIPSYLIYSVKYSDGTTPANGDVLKHGRSKKYRIRIEFDNEETEPRSSNESYQVKVTIPYIQHNRGPIPQIDFTTSSWDDIIDVYERDVEQLQTIMENGTTREVQLDMNNDGVAETTAHLRIANLSTPEECSTEGFSQSACGLVIEFAEVITTHRMNPYSNDNRTTRGINGKGGWEYSDMRAYVNSGVYAYQNIDYSTSGIYNALPSDLKSKIISTEIVSGHSSNDSTNFTTIDKLYLLDPREVLGTSYNYQYDTAKNFERQLDYYHDIGVTASNFSGASKKNLSGNNAYWWMRSADSSGLFNFLAIHTSGNYSGYQSSDNTGVSPAFRIG